MNYIVLGSIGFAQFGTDDYHQKRSIENKVLNKIAIDNFSIPERISHMCYISIKSFPYEYGSYDELVLMYNESLLNEWEIAFDNWDEDVANEPLESQLFTIFWTFANQAQEFDFEAEEYLEQCSKLYAKEFPMKVVHKNKSNNILKAI